MRAGAGAAGRPGAIRLQPRALPNPTLPILESGLTPIGPRSFGQSSVWQGADWSFICMSPDARNDEIQVASLSHDRNSCSFRPLFPAPNLPIHSESSLSRAEAVLPGTWGLTVPRRGSCRLGSNPGPTAYELCGPDSPSASASAECQTELPAPVRKQAGCSPGPPWRSSSLGDVGHRSPLSGTVSSCDMTLEELPP